MEICRRERSLPLPPLCAKSVRLAGLMCGFHQLRLQLNLGSVQGLRDGAVLLGHLSLPEECLLINAGDISLCVEVDGSDFIAVANLPQMDLGRRVDALWRMACLGESIG